MNILKLFATLLISCATVSAAKWYTANDGRPYFIQREQSYNWFEAFDECSRQNLQLVEIDSEEKNSALQEMLKIIASPSLYLWLGANDEFKGKKQFVWASSGQPMSYATWAPGEPNNLGGSENCVHVQGVQDITWNDKACDKKFGFICEEHNLQTEFRRRLEVKRLHVGKVLQEAFSDYLHQQKIQIKQLTNNIEEIDHKNTELATALPEGHKKMQQDIGELLKEHQLAQAKTIEETTKSIGDQDLALKTSIEAVYEKYSKIFADAQNEIEKYLIWDRKLEQ